MDPDSTPITLGTLADLGVAGLPLDVAADVLKAHERGVRGRCRECRKKLAAVIHDGSNGGPKRKVYGLNNNGTGDRQLCDPCAELLAMKEAS